MKQQTYIAIIRDKDFKQMDFERFCCKKVDTVIENMRKLFKSDLYRACCKGAVSVAIYATPDGINKEDNPCACFNLE